jgi:hypothetical protein
MNTDRLYTCNPLHRIYLNSNLVFQELKQIIESKEEDLRRCKDLHNKEVTELNDANRELQQNFDKVL